MPRKRLLKKYGEYIVVREIARDAKGVAVCEARLKQFRKRRFALKVIPVNLATKADVARAKLDIRVASSVSHPFVAAYADAFVLETGDSLVFWYSPLTSFAVDMHLGASLDNIIKYLKDQRTHMDQADAWSILIQCLVFLNEFRKFGIINGRIHASNIVWEQEHRVVYYPRSFIMLYSSNVELSDEQDFVW